MSKSIVLDAFKRMAFACELLEDARRAKAYGGAVWGLRSAPDLVPLHAEGKLKTLRGIGASLAAFIGECLDAGGPPAELLALEAQIPPGVLEFRLVKGLGPKKAAQLWREVGLSSIGELEQACAENRLILLKGFGEKTQAKVLASIQMLRRNAGLFRRDGAREALLSLEIPGLKAIGAWARGAETVDRIEALVPIGSAAPAGFEAADGHLVGTVQGVPTHLWSAGAEVWGAAEVWLGAAPEYRARLEAKLPAGSSWDAEGLVIGGERVATPDSAAVFAALGLHPVAVEQWEVDGPVVPLSEPAPPRLVERSDILGALHNHTTASDGLHSVAQMQAAATAMGLKWLGISDHSQSAVYASGLDEAALSKQRREITKANATGGCQLLCGIESDILADGSLDYGDDALGALDFVIASIHSRYGQGEDAMTPRVLRAARNPWTAVFGHPTGRLVLSRAPAPFDMAALLDACAENECVVELNASARRLDLSVEHLKMAKARGLKISIGPDAHSVDGLNNLEWGLTQARRAGLTPDDVINSWSLDTLRAWLEARRERAQQLGAQSAH